MAEQKATLLVQLKDQATEKLNGIGKAITNFKTAVTAFVASKVLVGLKDQFLDIANRGADLENLKKSFESLTAAAGVSSSELLGKLKASSQGTISETELIEKANKALLLIGGDVAGKLPNLLEIARASAKATGQDFEFLFNSVIAGIGRGSPLILDNLGLTIKLSEVYGKFAENVGVSSGELTKQQQIQALMNDVLEKGNELIKDTGVGAASSTDNIGKLQTSFKNLSDTLIQKVSPALMKFSGAVAIAINALNNELNKSKADVESIEVAWESLGKTMIDTKNIVLDLNNEQGKQVKNVSDAIAAVDELTSAYEGNAEALKQLRAERERLQGLLDAEIEKEKEAAEAKADAAAGAAAEQARIRREETQAEKDAISERIAAGEAAGRAYAKQAELDKKARLEVEESYAKATLGILDDLASVTEASESERGKAIGNAIKSTLLKIIDIYVSSEITKATTGAPLSFGATLAAIGPIVAAGAAGKAAINAVEFAKGGSFVVDQPTSAKMAGGGTAVFGEAGPERVDITPLTGPNAKRGQGITVNVYLDEKQIGRSAQKYLKDVRVGLN